MKQIKVIPKNVFGNISQLTAMTPGAMHLRSLRFVGFKADLKDPVAERVAVE